MVTDKVWKLPAVVNRFLSHRTAIPLAQEQIGVMTSILKSRTEPVENFLDLGCGDGILGAAILGEYPASRGVLADFSEAMLQEARGQLKEYANQLVFENLDYADPAWVNRMQAYGPFDAIVSGYSIHHQPDARQRDIYKEIFLM
ncbi:MAG: class I SAM-dependent methyltransferase, partial [Chloroflexi bacterium]